MIEKEKQHINTKRLTDFIDIDRDFVEDNSGIFAIYAGTGAGKTSLIEGYHDENTDFEGLAERFKILLITSRKAKVKETTKYKEVFLDTLYDYDISHIIHNSKKNYSIVGTNAHLHTYIQKNFRATNESTYFWRAFDFVVVDEFHSIATDAAFTDCATTIYHLIQMILDEYRRNKCKTKIMLLSATPDPCKWLCDQTQAKIYDYRDRIKSLKPSCMKIFPYTQVKKIFMQQVLEGKMVIYYLAQFDKLNDLIKSAIESGISEEEIVVSISDDERKNALKKDHQLIYQNIEIFEKVLTEESVISPQFKFIITNSRCKEAININTQIDLLVIENHYSVDIEQICGRFRKGVKEAYLVSDARQFELPDAFIDEREYYESLLDNDNQELRKRISSLDIKHRAFNDDRKVKKFVECLLRQSKYRTFNLLLGQFEINTPYIKYREHYLKNLHDVEMRMNAKEQFRSSLLFYFIDINIEYCEYLDPQHHIMKWYHEKGLGTTESILNHEQFKELIEHLKKSIYLLANAPKREYEHAQRILKCYGASYKRVGRKSKADENSYKVTLDIA